MLAVPWFGTGRDVISRFEVASLRMFEPARADVDRPLFPMVALVTIAFCVSGSHDRRATVLTLSAMLWRTLNLVSWSPHVSVTCGALGASFSTRRSEPSIHHSAPTCLTRL